MEVEVKVEMEMELSGHVNDDGRVRDRADVSLPPEVGRLPRSVVDPKGGRTRNVYWMVEREGAPGEEAEELFVEDPSAL